MAININRNFGYVLLLIFGIVFGLGLIFNFRLPDAVNGVWIVAGCILALIGTNTNAG